MNIFGSLIYFIFLIIAKIVWSSNLQKFDNDGSEIHLCSGLLGNQCRAACQGISKTEPKCDDSRCLCLPDGDCKWHVLKFIRILEPLAGDESGGSCDASYRIDQRNFCDVQFGEGECHYRCRGVGYSSGRCNDKVCQCSNNERQWNDLTEEVEEQYRIDVCSSQNGEELCAIYCRHLKHTIGTCTTGKDYCNCHENEKDDEKTQIQMEIDGICEDEGRMSLDCRYKCTGFGHYNGHCRTGNGYLRRCQCLNTDNESYDLTIKDYYENGVRKDNEEEFERKIIRGPCSKIDCDIACNRQRQFDGQCEGNICKCKTTRKGRNYYEYEKIVTEKKEILIQTEEKFAPKVCGEGSEGHCTYLCEGVGFKYGRCYKEKCQCSTANNENHWVDLTKELEENYKRTACEETYKCSRYCRRFLQSPHQCGKEGCSCDEDKRLDEKTEIQNEIIEKCENPQRENIDCKYKCLQLGNKNGICKVEKNRERNCHCQDYDDQWKPLEEKDYFEGGIRKDRKEEIERDATEGPCVEEACDISCYEKRQYEGRCERNICQCKTSRKEDSWSESKAIERDSKKYTHTENRITRDEEDTFELVNRLCKTEYGEGDCNYRCGGVGHIYGRCHDQRCECSNTGKQWFPYGREMEQNYEDNVCPTYAGVPSCSRYCVRIKQSPGQCLDKCHCREDLRSLENTKIDNEIEELCQNPNKMTVLCDYKCKSLQFLKGVCEKSSKKFECYCEDKNQNWKRLSRSDFLEHGDLTDRSHTDEFIEKIRKGPCISSDCEYGCVKIYQFGGRCEDGICKCKTSRLNDEWHNYEDIINNRRRDPGTDSDLDIQTPGTREVSCTQSTALMCSEKCLYNAHKRYDAGECKDYVCQCYDSENEKWDRLREYDDTDTDHNVCQNEIGEGKCNYQCVGLGYIKGRCNGKKCQCLQTNKEWVYLTPELEHEFKKSACIIKRGDVKLCSKYCWRFKHGSGECKEETCICNESERNDDHNEIDNEIIELCENEDRDNFDCRFKCKKLMRKDGDCRIYNEERTCYCADDEGNWKPLTRDNYYNEDGKRIDSDSDHYDKDIIEKICTMTECNAACHKQKQFAGICEKEACYCKITRDEENWRTYQKVVVANKYDEIAEHTRTCTVKVCQNRCRGVNFNGDCMDDVCKCYDTKQRQWRKYTEILEDTSKPGDPKYEACLRDAGEGSCNYLCRGVGLVLGKCDGKICQCLSHLKDWIDLTEMVENDFKTSVCRSENPDDCSKYCWRFSRTSGQCKDNTCTCDKMDRNNEQLEIKNEIEELCSHVERQHMDCTFKCVHLGKTNGTCLLESSKYVCTCLDCDEVWEPLVPSDFYEEGERIDNKEIENADIIQGTCSTTECDVVCIRQRQFSGLCIAGTCECQATRDNSTWYTYKHIVEENKLYEERTEVLDVCLDHKKCSRVCRREGTRRGSCKNQRCQCTTNSGEKEYIDEIVTKNRHEDEDILQTCSNDYKCHLECEKMRRESGTCTENQCICTNKNKTKENLKDILNKNDVKTAETPKDICEIDTGEGRCNYRCVGLGYIKGRCNNRDGKRCQCLTKEDKWIDLIPELEDQHKNSVCKAQNSDEHCFKYCWRFKQSPGNCENTICKCDESKRHDERHEIKNEIEELCETSERQDIDCTFKCNQLKKKDGNCRIDKNSRRTCYCENNDGNWNPLTENDYYDRDGKRIDDRRRQEDILVNKPCTMNSECDAACYQQKQFAGKCEKGICICKTTRDEENWRKYEQVVNETRQAEEEEGRPEALCSVAECQNQCGNMREGNCIDGVCKCSDTKQRESRKPTEFDEDTSKTENVKKTSCSVGERLMCNDKCKFHTNNKYKSGDCVDDECQCHDQANNKWVKYEEVQNLTKTVTEEELNGIIEKCLDNEKCAAACRNEGSNGGTCITQKCQCNDIDKGSEPLDKVIKENRRTETDICNSDIGEGHCNYRCIGLGYIRGRCNGKKCQCLENRQTWIDLTPAVEEGFTTSVCKVVNGEDKECSKYCWRFKQSHGECQKGICRCNENKRNEEYDEIYNGIVELCEDPKRQNVDCRSKCTRLGKRDGKCEEGESGRNCYCEDRNNNWRPLSREDYYTTNGSRIEHRVHHVRDIINNICSETECDVACHEEKQFAGKCDKDVCHCKITRDGEIWRTYQEIVNEERYEEETKLLDGTCLATECHNKCGEIKHDGDCIDDTCKCYDTEKREWRRHTDFIEDIIKPGKPRNEVCMRETGEGNCNYLCRGLGYAQGRCNDKKCQCLVNNRKWIDLTETVENDYKKSVCKATSKKIEDCSKYCWRFYQASGACKDGTCTCNEQDRNNERNAIQNEIEELCETPEGQNTYCEYKCNTLGKLSGKCEKRNSKLECLCQATNKKWSKLTPEDYYDKDGKRKDNKEDPKENILKGTCKTNECYIGCYKEKQFDGNCDYGTCLCKVRRDIDVWHRYKRVIDENEYYQERTEVFDHCLDSEKCGNVCRYEGLKGGKCSKGKCQCTDHSGKTIDIEDVVNKNRPKDVTKGNTVECTASTRRMCYEKCRYNTNNVFNSGDCVADICQCYDRQNNEWVEYREEEETDSKSVTISEKEIDQILEKCTDDEKCSRLCRNEGRKGGACTNDKCQCSDDEKGKEDLSAVIKENKRKDSGICQTATGEGYCDYRCAGLGFSKGRCNGDRCQCRKDNGEWINLTPGLEEDFKISACKVENGEYKECSRYCWRFEQSPGECKKKICKCDESKRNDKNEEIKNEIEELCDDSDRQHVDCNYKCQQLGKKNGKCDGANSGRKCSCEDRNGYRKTLTKEDYYNKNGSSMYDRTRHENELIRDQCVRSECDVGCHEQKQFASKCEKGVCHCKTRRDGDNWRTYQEVVHEKRNDETKRNQGTCAVTECQDKCGKIQRDGDCIESICKCYDVYQRKWEMYVDRDKNTDESKQGDEVSRIIRKCTDNEKCATICVQEGWKQGTCTNVQCRCDDKEKGNDSLENIIKQNRRKDTDICQSVIGEGNCNYRCVGLGFIRGRCYGKKCQCLQNEHNWIDLTPEVEQDFMISVCKVADREYRECSRYCWRFKQSPGECKKEICKCDQSERNNEHEEIRHEIQELCEDPNRQNVDCKFKCQQLGKKNGQCDRENYERQCSCEDIYGNWKTLTKEDYYSTNGSRIVSRIQREKEVINEQCSWQNCDIACHEKKQFNGKCENNVCHCKITNDGDNWRTYQEIVNEERYEKERKDRQEKCLVSDCQNNCGEFGHDGDCIEDVCKCYDTQQRQWKKYSDLVEETSTLGDPKYEVCQRDTGEGNCNYLCRGVGHLEGRCNGNRCQCLSNNQKWIDLTENVENDYKKSVCKAKSGSSDDCSKYCWRFSKSSGECKDETCTCNKEDRNNERDEIKNELDELCELPDRGSKDCSVKCAFLGKVDGTCQKKYSKCYCHGSNRILKPLDPKDYYDEDGKRKDNKEEYNRDIINNPCKEKECDVACSRQRQFGGTCSAGECECKVLKDTDVRVSYKRIVEENEYYEERTEVFNSCIDDNSCGNVCRYEGQKSGSCSNEICKCTDHDGRTKDLHDVIEHNRNKEEDSMQGNEVSCTAETRRMCYNKCHHNTNNKYTAGDCVDDVCQCFDRPNDKWVKYRERDNQTKSAMDEALDEILEHCSDSETCSIACQNESWKEGTCTNEKCECYDYVKGKEYLDKIIKENRREDSHICKSGIGEGQCNYRCLGLGHIKGRCNGNKCQCLQNDQKWIDLTPKMEEDFTITVCKVRNGEDKECSRYCWRFKQSPGECKNEVCTCDENKRNDKENEIRNEIEELCEDPDRQDVDCKAKCSQLGKTSGNCQEEGDDETSERNCICVGPGGKLKPLTIDDYLDKDGSRIDDRYRNEQDIIASQCSRSDCDVACHEKKQFAGKCEKNVCHCKITREEENWRTYQEIVNEERFEEDNKNTEGTCSITECQNKCGAIKRDGDCIDNICKCYDIGEREWKKYTDLIVDTSKPGNPKYEACQMETGEGNCGYLCRGLGHIRGRCSDKKCQCLTNNQEWVDLTDTLENGYKKYVCIAASGNNEDCSKYCWRFLKATGECKDNTCTCKKETVNEREKIKNEIQELCDNPDRKDIDCQYKCTKLGKVNGKCEKKYNTLECNCQGIPLNPNDYYDRAGKRIDDEEQLKTNILTGPCVEKECDVGCSYQKQLAGTCKDGACECQLTRDTKLWTKYRRVVEENEYYEERTEVFDECLDSEKCGNVCRYEGMKGGNCANEKCQCIDHTGRKDYIQNIVKRKQIEVCQSQKDEENCSYHCAGLGYNNGICGNNKCQCTNNEQKWIDLTSEVEDEFTKSVCQVENGEDERCYTYCLRFKQSPGDCRNGICECNESQNILYNCSDDRACRTVCGDFMWYSGKCLDAQCQCDNDKGEHKNLEDIIREQAPKDEAIDVVSCSINKCKADCSKLNMHGDCVKNSCQCYNERRNRWDELDQLEVCQRDMGEGDCDYRCKGVAYREGKCEKRSCECLADDEKWIDLTPEVEDEYQYKVCKGIIGKQQDCSRYCWRFWKAPGECQNRKCTCDENKEHDPHTEIENEIKELCENEERKDLDCENKCKQLGKVCGSCVQVKSEKQCHCEDMNGKMAPLTPDEFYEGDERKDKKEDIIRGSCLKSECDSACYTEKQFAGRCRDSHCECKVTRTIENWRNYEDVVKERRHDPRRNDCSYQCNKKCISINQRAGECQGDICQCIGYRNRDWKPYDELLKEKPRDHSEDDEEELFDNCTDDDKCLQACNFQTWNEGQCVDKRCECTDDKKPTRDLEEIMKHTASGEYESDIYHDKCEDTKCNTACSLESWHNGKCSKNKCECYNKNGDHKYLDEVKKNQPGAIGDEKTCNDKKDHDCYDKCHILRQYTGQCRLGECECQSSQTRKLWHSYEELVTDTEVVHKVNRDTSYPAVTCKDNKYCKEKCSEYTTGVCSNEECECRLEDGSWKKMWEIEEMQRISELDNILIEELSQDCMDNTKCQLVCTSYNKPYGACYNKVCKCQNEKDQSFTPLTDVVKVQQPKRLTSKEVETMYGSCSAGRICKRMCQCYRQAYGDCNKEQCYCMDDFTHKRWSSFKEVIYKESHTVIRSYAEYKSYEREYSEREKHELCTKEAEYENLCDENCQSLKQYQGKCQDSAGCFCQTKENGAWRLYEDVKKQTDRENILKNLYEDCVNNTLCREECKLVEHYNGQCLENQCTCNDQMNNRKFLKDLHRLKESKEKCVEDTCSTNCKKFDRTSSCEESTCFCISKDGHMHDYKDLKQRDDIKNQHLVDNCEDDAACRSACKTYEQSDGTCEGKSCQCNSHLGKRSLKEILDQHYRSDEYAQQEELAEQVATSEMCPRLQGSQICIVRCIQLNQTAGKCTDKAVCYCKKEEGLWRTYEEVSELHRMADNIDLCSVDNSQHVELCTKKCKATGRNEGSCSQEKGECSCLNSVGKWGRLEESDSASSEDKTPENNIMITKTEEKELIRKAIQAGSITKQDAKKFILCKYTQRHQNRCRTLCKGVGHRYGKCYSNVCLCKQQKGTWKRLKTKYVDLEKIAEIMKQEVEEVEEDGPAECHIRFHGRVKIHCLQNIAKDLQDQFCSQDCNKLNRPGGSCDQETQRCTCNFHSDFNS